MANKKHKSQNQPQQTKLKKGSINSLAFIKEALTLIGGLAGSILAVYGLVKCGKIKVMVNASSLCQKDLIGMPSMQS